MWCGGCHNDNGARDHSRLDWTGLVTVTAPLTAPASASVVVPAGRRCQHVQCQWDNFRPARCSARGPSRKLSGRRNPRHSQLWPRPCLALPVCLPESAALHSLTDTACHPQNITACPRVISACFPKVHLRSQLQHLHLHLHPPHITNRDCPRPPIRGLPPSAQSDTFRHQPSFDQDVSPLVHVSSRIVTRLSPPQLYAARHCHCSHGPAMGCPKTAQGR